MPSGLSTRFWLGSCLVIPKMYFGILFTLTANERQSGHLTMMEYVFLKLLD